MAMSQHQFQQYLQQQQQTAKTFRNVYNIDGQLSLLPDHSHHPPYIPPFQVAGLAPVAVDASEGGLDQWSYGTEPKRRRPKEQDFLDNNNNNNSQISSLDILHPPSVSTGLGLSLDNGRFASSGDSPFLALISHDVERELQRQDADIDRYIKIQGDRMRQAVLEKVQSNQLQTISYVEEKFAQKLREKEAEVETINKKNMELELQMEQLASEVGAWQQRAKYNENIINTLNFNIQQVNAQSRDTKEGCGDSEVDDTASCFNGRAIEFHLLGKDTKGMKELMTCKACKVNEVCMLLLPCKHLCLCKECESMLSFCPLCESSKYIGMEVYM